VRGFSTLKYFPETSLTGYRYQSRIHFEVRKIKGAKLFSILIALLVSPTLSYAINSPATLNASFDQKSNSVLVSWSKTDSAASYNVYRKESQADSAVKINSGLVTDNIYRDLSIAKGRDYTYTVRAVDAQGIESADSLGAGAPLMTIAIRALVDTSRSKPVEKRSIRSGKLVTFASQGDMITYAISYVNRGCSTAKNASINFDIPNGTLIAGAPTVKNGSKIYTYYYDKISGKWLNKVIDENRISKVRMMISDPIPPTNEDKVSGSVNLKVIITL
jgi:uncharacterized repeat protein (TIGR01451 family)